MNPSAVTRHLVVRGLVQGVSYRWSMVQAARRLGVRGWVRNRRDGSVEALVQGDAAAVDALIAWCRRGPPASHVEDVAVAPAEIESGAADFSHRPTA